MQTQKERIQELQQQVQCAKRTYATSLKSLEQISEEIHKMRGDLCNAAPSGPREPGVGAELTQIPPEIAAPLPSCRHPAITVSDSSSHSMNVLPPTTTLDYATELDRCEVASIGCATSRTTSTAVSERGDEDDDDDDDDGSGNDPDNRNIDLDLEVLRQKVKVLAVRPVEGGDGEQTQDVWETELNETVNKLDRLLLKREMNVSSSASSTGVSVAAAATPPIIGASLPVTPLKSVSGPIKMLQKAEPLPTVNVSMRELPLLTRISNEIAERTQKFSKRRMSLE